MVVFLLRKTTLLSLVRITAIGKMLQEPLRKIPADPPEIGRLSQLPYPVSEQQKHQRRHREGDLLPGEVFGAS